MFLSFRSRKFVTFYLEFEEVSEFQFQPNVVVHLTSLIHIFYGVWTHVSFFVNGFLHSLAMTYSYDYSQTQS